MSADDKTKLNKSLKEVIAENIDNTASVRDIVSSIGIRTRKGQIRTLPHYINSTTRQRGKPGPWFCFSDFFMPSTPRNLFSAEWDGGLNSGYFEQLHFKSLMPWMLTGAQHVGEQDPLVDLLRQKRDWNNQWTRFRSSQAITLGQRRQTRLLHKWLADDVLYCPKVYVDMAGHIEKNPDPFFTEPFNWYYSGEGNLQITRLDGHDLIMHSEFNCLYVSPYCKDSLSIDYSNGAKYSCPEDTNILETSHSQEIIALRTKYKIIILQMFTAELPLKLQRLKEIDSELPFTSAKFDRFHKNMLYVTTLDFKLTIVNLTRMAARSVKLRGKFKKLTDNWNMVVSGERFNYAHVSKKAITVYDKRTNQPFQRMRSFKHMVDTQTCCHLTAVKYCDEKPLMYVTTEHHLFLMDMRCSKTVTGNIKPVQRWTHGMMCPPTYIDFCPYDPGQNKELVCLTSQWMEDMCLVTNYSDTVNRIGEIPGMCIPYRPHSILDTFNKAHRQKLCYTSYDTIQRRLCTSISGLAVVSQGDHHSVLMQNALGDISCHALYPKQLCAFIDDDSIEKLHVWCKDYHEEPPMFEVSHVIDIKPVLKQLREVPENFVFGSNPAIVDEEKFDENEIYTMFDKEILDPEFLEIWKEKSGEITIADITVGNGAEPMDADDDGL